MALGRITTTSLAESAYQRLVGAILQGTITAGDRLVQEDLAEQLGISRTPVREALLRMERAGLVRSGPGRGFVVPELTWRDIEQLYGLREAVEGHAARLVVERGPAAVEQVDRELRELAGQDWTSGPGAYHGNRLAHRALVVAADNALLLEVFDDLWGRGVALRTWGDYYLAHTGPPDLEADHADVLQALRASPQVAVETTVRHVRAGLAGHRGR